MKIFKLMRKHLLVVVVLISWSISGLGQKISGKFQDSIVPHVLLVKLTPNNRAFFSTSSAKAEIKAFDNIVTIKQTYPNKKPLTQRDLVNKKVDLSLVYSLETKQGEDVIDIQNELIELGVFEYVEQKRRRFTSASPNDPLLVNQSYFSQINAFAAWDVTTGSTVVKIGIVDTGSDMDHPDLVTEMWENSADPVNGVDDDGDGFVDNFLGWDFQDNDNDPQIVVNDHGAHVAGIAAAATNNAEGVASVGYQTLFVPIRVGNGTSIDFGYEGIVYAADLGCDIINCSWGGFSFSQYEQDIINYATFNKDALVIAAAGNQNRDQAHYPAAYNNVLGVASVSSSDEKSVQSNYGYWVGISAPGQNIYSTIDNGSYNYNTGTSMAAPVVAGAAALVKAVYPQLSALQIAAQLKSTSLNIDGLNPGKEYKLGVGRINVHAAVSTPITNASVEFADEIITNKTDDVFKGDDSLFISGTFTNYLATSGTVLSTISTTSPYVALNNATLNLGIMSATLQIDNYTNPFSCKILPNAPLNEPVVFKIITTDGNFTTTKIIEVVINVDYLNIAINNISTSVGSKGQFGYNTDDQSQGLGMRLNGAVSQLYEGGVMIGTDMGGDIKVADRVRNGGSSSDDDFSPIQNVYAVSVPPKGDYYVTGIFNDANTFADSIGVTVTQNAYASNDLGHENYVVLEYSVLNASHSTITNLHVGLFADFDVHIFNKNQVFTDLQRFVTYTTSTVSNQPVFGVQLLTSTPFNSYGLDYLNGGNGGVDIFNNYNSTDKFTTLTTNRYNSGFGSSSGNDVIQVTSTGGFTLAPGDSILVAFALIAADHVSLMEEAADSAFYRYNGVLPNSIFDLSLDKSSVLIYPNPFKYSVTVDVSELRNMEVYDVSVFDVTGNKVLPTLVDKTEKTLELDLENLASGVYFIEVSTNQRSLVTKLIKN